MIPIESFDEQSWVHHVLKPPSLLIPYYSIWLDRNARAKASHYGDIHEVMRFNEPIGLSSIGPDECVTSEAFFADFVKFSTEHNFDYVVAWDEPTYADWPPDLSWKYTLYGLENVKRLLKQGFRVIGLINGSTEAHFEKCAQSLLSMGVDCTAVHVSDYLRGRKDSSLDPVLHDMMKVATSRFKKVLVIGGADPYFIKYELRPKFPNASVAGFGWYLDAARGIIYGRGGRVDVNETDVICDCASCSTGRSQDLSRLPRSRSIHNFLAVQGTMDGKDPPELERSGIVHRGQKMMLASDLYLGTDDSLVYDFIDALKTEKPRTLILLGNTFDLENAEPDALKLHTEDFFGLLMDYEIEVYPVYGRLDSSPATISKFIKRFPDHYNSQPNIHFSKYMEMDLDKHLFLIHKLYAIARDSIVVGLKNGETMYCAHGPLWPGMFPTSASLLEGLPSDIINGMLKVNKCDIIVLGGYRKEIIQEGRLYSLASWRRETPEDIRLGLEPDLKGALIISEDKTEYRRY